jgi:hypothetical protein
MGGGPAGKEGVLPVMEAGLADLVNEVHRLSDSVEANH